MSDTAHPDGCDVIIGADPASAVSDTATEREVPGAAGVSQHPHPSAGPGAVPGAATRAAITDLPSTVNHV